MKALWIRRVWERQGFLGKLFWLLFLPVSGFYLAAVRLRSAFYARGWLRADALPRPVVSIGNLTVGGAGKTPTCLWLAEELAKRGFKVAILSRGYRRKDSRPALLQGDGRESAVMELDPSRVGDEPLMMALLYGKTVGVGADRYQTGRELLSRQEVDVFLLDDGYQHRQLKRDLDLLLLTSDRRGWLLPAGRLREPRSSLKRADYFLLRDAESWRPLLPADGAQRAFTGSLTPVELIGFDSNRRKEYPLSLLYRSKILAISGIADAREFYRMIYEWEGEIIETLEFPDHHSYSAGDWQRISRLSRRADLIVTTEKDILKLMRFPFARDKLLALRVAMKVENGDLLVEAVVKKISTKGSPGNA